MMPPRRRPHGGGLERRRFQQHVDRRVGHFAIDAPHHAGDGDGPLGVGNDAGVRGKFVLLVVDRLEFLARLRGADDDLAAGKLRKVERVERLAALEHHVVRDVDDVVDHRDAERAEAIGGRLSFESKQGQGTELILLVPMARDR